MKIVVIGGSGLIGTKLVKLLRERGDEALPASPSSGVNSVTGEGLAEALAGAQVVVDVSNSPSWEDKAVLEFFGTSTRNLLAAEAAAGAVAVGVGEDRGQVDRPDGLRRRGRRWRRRGLHRRRLRDPVTREAPEVAPDVAPSLRRAPLVAPRLLLQ